MRDYRESRRMRLSKKKNLKKNAPKRGVRKYKRGAYSHGRRQIGSTAKKSWRYSYQADLEGEWSLVYSSQREKGATRGRRDGGGQTKKKKP